MLQRKRKVKRISGWIQLNPAHPGPGPVTYIYDSFTDTTGTDINSHTPDTSAGGWASYNYVTGAGASGAATIQTNQLRPDVNERVYLIDATVSNYTLTVEWTPGVGGTNRSLVVVRAQSGTQFYAVRMRETEGDIYLLEYPAVTTRDSSAFVWTEGVTYTIEVVCLGNDIDVSVNSTPYLSYSSATYATNTLVGLGRGLSTNHDRFDNFQVMA